MNESINRNASTESLPDADSRAVDPECAPESVPPPPVIPDVDRRRAEQLSLPVVEEKTEVLPNFRRNSGLFERIYPFTRSRSLVNDGVAYGQVVEEVVWYLQGEGAEARLVQREVSLRLTRTGKIRLTGRKR